MKLRRLFIPALPMLAVAGYAAWYYSRPESPPAAYQRIQRAWVNGDHGEVWDRLDEAARAQVDEAYPLLVVQEADKLTDPGEAHRLANLRGRELFVEVSRRGYSLTTLQWAQITSVEVDGDRARLLVERPPNGDHPTAGFVQMTRKDGVWKLSAAK